MIREKVSCNHKGRKTFNWLTFNRTLVLTFNRSMFNVYTINRLTVYTFNRLTVYTFNINAHTFNVKKGLNV